MALFAGLIYGEEFQVLSGDKSHTPLWSPQGDNYPT